jgi:uncharacterized protein
MLQVHKMVRANRDFQVFAKPAGPLCNIECQYCYYSKHQSQDQRISSLRMSPDLLEKYIVQHIAASAGPVITFSWHGGEPTILGLDYFRRIVAIQKKHVPRSKSVFNGIQTNGVLIDDEWSRFLASENFGVGLSMDGPPELHDQYRQTRGKEGTHRKALEAFHRLQRQGITCDILCAVHDKNVLQPIEVYRFFKETGGRYIGFLPIVEFSRGDKSPGSHTVPSKAFGDFLCAIFDEWKERDIGRVTVQIFDEAARPVQGLEHSLCIFRKTCGNIPAIEHDGTVYSCDHFVDEEHQIGNIHDTEFERLLNSPRQREFGRAKWASLPRHCRECEVLDTCNGGCPKDRFDLTPEGEPGLNYLCEGFKQFFVHSRPFFIKVSELARIRQKQQQSKPAVGRNDPCPCGSRLKYKKCCGAGQRTEPRP